MRRSSACREYVVEAALARVASILPTVISSNRERPNDDDVSARHGLAARRRHPSTASARGTISAIVNVMVKPFFAAVLLFACVGVHALELSGHWDRTLTDANDEAGVVAVVLCIGAAIAATRAVLKSIRLCPLRSTFPVPSSTASVQLFSHLPVSSMSASRPPAALRI